MRELVRCAHDKRFKHVAGVKLVIDGIEIQARLLSRRSCRQGIILSIKKLKMRVVHADLDQNRLQQLTVRFPGAGFEIRARGREPQVCRSPGLPGVGGETMWRSYADYPAVPCAVEF